MAPIEPEQILQTNEEGEVHVKPVVGIIHPPPEVRNIVDKTASFVARNGPEFETRIRQNELNNPKFNFLNPSDPYHSYYQYKVKEFKEGKGHEPAAPKPVLPTRPSYEPALPKFTEPVVPKEPPPEFEFIADPPSISAFDLDVVKLTAQFVARNGRQFLTNLMNREKNYQFDFLRPQHSLFNYFTKLVEQYTKVLIPPKDLLPKLRKEADNPNIILEQVKYRVEWAKHQERERLKEEEAAERERVAYAQIDWHDFVVVETVDFPPHEQGNLPPPTTPEEVGARLLAQERFETAGEEDQTVEMEVESDEEEADEEEEEVAEERERSRPSAAAPGDDTQIQDMEEDSDSGDEMERSRARPREPAPPPPPPPPASTTRPQPPPLPPTPEEVIIRKDYNPKAPKMVQPTPAPDQFLISPITGEKIPAAKIHEHVRIGLLDPKWIEQRDRQLADKRDQEEVYAAGSSIGSNLKQLAERRTDIFGSGAEEAQIGKKIGEEERRVKEKVTWDGHTASMERVTQKARENISIEEQIAVIHKVKGLLPDEEKEKIGPAMPKEGEEPPQRPPPPPPQPQAQPQPQAPPQSQPQPHPAPPTQAPSVAPVQPPQPMPPSAPPQPKPPVNQPPKSAAPPVRPSVTAVPMPPRPPQMMLVPQRPPMPPGPPDSRHHMYQMRPPMPPMPPGHPMQPHPGFMHGGPPMHAPQIASLAPQQQQPPPRHQPPPPDDEPPSKKAKTEEDLLPEDEFLKRNKGPVSFRVAVPSLPDKPEWKANGQLVTLTMPLTDSVAVIKAKIHEAIGMPAGKQKLQFDGLFIKDSNTLAFYNFSRNATVQLQLKERGGRKK